MINNNSVIIMIILQIYLDHLTRATVNGQQILSLTTSQKADRKDRNHFLQRSVIQALWYKNIERNK